MPRWSCRLFLLLVLLLAHALAAPVHIAEPGSEPAWLSEVNVFTGGFSNGPFTGVIWGSPPFPSESREVLIADIEHWRRRGGPYHGELQFENTWLGFQVEPAFAALDINLDPIPAPGGLEANLHSPTWQDQLAAWAKDLIDLGANGVVIDGYNPNVEVVLHPGGSFDDLSMADFRHYLGERYSDPELLARFGLADLKKFNYRDWIIANGKQSTWNVPPFSGLAAEFFLHQWHYAVDFFKGFRSAADSYALDTYGRRFLVTHNNGSLFYQAAEADDVLLGEFFYFDVAGRLTPDLAASAVKLGRAITAAPVVLLPEIAGDTARTSTRNLIKLVLAEIYGAGGAANFQEDMLNRYEEDGIFETLIDPAVVYQYNSFILGNPGLYEGLRSTAKTAVVYSSSSELNRDIEVDDWHDGLFSHYGYLGMSKLLLESNVQHDVVFFPDERFHERRIDQDMLTPYDCLILDNIWAMSADQVDALLEFVESGGVVIAAGQIGTHDVHGKLAPRPVLEGLTSPGTHSLGDGTFVYFEEDLGTRYNSVGDQEVKRLMIDEIGKVVEPQVLVSNGGRAFVFAYQEASGPASVLHVVNYDYLPAQDRFDPATDLTIKLRAAPGEYRATGRSPEFAGYVSYEAEWADDYATFTIPELEAYTVVTVDADGASGACLPSSTVLCTNANRFRIKIDWTDHAGNTGPGRVVPFSSEDSGLFWFFNADNWEMLVKVLDACQVNDRFWVFAAATTDVEYRLRVTDTKTGAVEEYVNLLGNRAAAITDTDAFATCSGGGASTVPARRGSEPHRRGTAIESPGAATGAVCSAGPSNLCLNGDRFHVEVDWRDPEGNTGSARTVGFGSEDSGLFWFFNADNWEMLVKVLDGCRVNGNFWVFAAATTDVEYTLRVSDFYAGTVSEYFNPLRNASAAITDTAAFATCP